MDHRDTFHHLVSSSKSLDEPPKRSSTASVVQFLLDYAHNHQPLGTQAAWRLSPKVEREIEAAAGFRPPGGWAHLTGLLAGTRHLKAKHDGFILLEKVDPRDLTDSQLQVELVEAMTRKLVPPATAASIFIALGIHPAWGLRLAWEVQNASRGDAWAAIPPMGELLSAEGLEPARKAVFVFIALTVGVLERLQPHQSYTVDAFASVLEDVVSFARSVGKCRVKPGEDHLSCFLNDHGSNRRVIQVLARDLLDDVFVAAGVVRDVGDARFAVTSDALDSVQVDEMTKKERDAWLAAFLDSTTTESPCEASAIISS